MHNIYKIKNKLLISFIIVFLLLSVYMINNNITIKDYYNQYNEKSIVSQYEIYKIRYNKSSTTNTFTIENKDYIDNSDMINEYQKSTPLFTVKKNKVVEKDEISFQFFIKSDIKQSSIEEKVSKLQDLEYFITYNKKNQIILFGKVFDDGYVQINKNMRDIRKIEKELDSIMIQVFALGFFNILLMLYLILLIRNMKVSAINLNDKFEQMQENTKKIAFNDTLTGAATRLKFDVVLEELVDISTRFEEHQFSVIMIDIDNFKKVNDTFGHDYGDIVLKNVSKVILSNIRKSDTFARWGGEEFVIIVPLCSLEDTCLFADKIRELISRLQFEKLEQITCSFGVAEFQKGDDVQSIMKRVDDVLYLAKDKGKNRVEC